MNDFLSHLAARAVAPVAAVRPVLPSIYEPPRLRPSESLEQETRDLARDTGQRDPVAAGNSARRTPQPASRARPPDAVYSPHAEIATAAHADGNRPRPDAVASLLVDPSLVSSASPIVQDTASAGGPPPGVALAARQNTQGASPPPPARQHHVPAQLREKMPAAAPHNAPLPSASDDLAPLLRAETSREAPETSRRDSRDAERSHLPPLSAPVRDENAQPRPRPGTLAPVMVSARTESRPLTTAKPAPVIAPPQITVTIGRVEIRAVTPQARPGPTLRRGAPRLSLDAYLDRKPGAAR